MFKEKQKPIMAIPFIPQITVQTKRMNANRNTMPFRNHAIVIAKEEMKGRRWKVGDRK